MKKRKKIDQLSEVSPYLFEGSLDKVRKEIDTLISLYGSDATLDWEPDFYYPYDSRPSPRFTVTKERDETDEECNKRIANEARTSKEREENERREFERLYKKFGNNTN